MGERETIMDLIRNEYDPRPKLGKLDWPGFEWDDGAGRIADAVLSDQTLLLRKHADLLAQIRAHLGAILVQTIDSDDQIIIDHVRKAHELAGGKQPFASPPGHEICSNCKRVFKFGDTCTRGGCPCGGDV